MNNTGSTKYDFDLVGSNLPTQVIAKIEEITVESFFAVKDVDSGGVQINGSIVSKTIGNVGVLIEKIINDSGDDARITRLHVSEAQ